MFISKALLNEILDRLDRAERKGRSLEERFQRESHGNCQKYAVLLARIKAGEENRFIRDTQTGKALPIVTGIAESANELELSVVSAASMATAAPVATAEMPEPPAAPESLNSAGPAARFEWFRNQGAAAREEFPLLTDAERNEKDESWNRLYRRLRRSLRSARLADTPADPAEWFTARGHRGTLRLAQSVAPVFCAFLEARPGRLIWPSELITDARQRGLISAKRAGAKHTAFCYVRAEAADLFRQAEAYVTDHADSFREFLAAPKEGLRHADYQTQEG